MRFHLRPSRSTFLTALLLVSVVLACLGGGAARAVRSKFHWLVWPVGEPGMALAGRFKQAVAPEPRLSAEDAERIRLENEQLHRQVRAMQSERQEFRRRMEQGETIFSRVFGPSADAPVRLIPARVVGSDSLPYGWGRLLSEGQSKGVREDMWVTNRILLTDREKKMTPDHLVLSGVSLVGRIQEAGAFTARMELINDRTFRIRANILRVIHPQHPREVIHDHRSQPLRPEINLPIPVLARGDGAGGLFVPDVPSVHDIRAGDVLQTRAESLVLPAVVEIGTVRNVRRDSVHSGMVTLEVTPSADLPSLRDVYIVVPIVTPPLEVGERR